MATQVKDDCLTITDEDGDKLVVDRFDNGKWFDFETPGEIFASVTGDDLKTLVDFLTPDRDADKADAVKDHEEIHGAFARAMDAELRGLAAVCNEAHRRPRPTGDIFFEVLRHAPGEAYYEVFQRIEASDLYAALRQIKDVQDGETILVRCSLGGITPYTVSLPKAKFTPVLAPRGDEV